MSRRERLLQDLRRHGTPTACAVELVISVIFTEIRQDADADSNRRVLAVVAHLRAGRTTGP